MKNKTIKKANIGNTIVTLQLHERGQYSRGERCDTCYISVRYDDGGKWGCNSTGSIDELIDEFHYICLCVRRNKRPHKPVFFSRVDDFLVSENISVTMEKIERRLKRGKWKNPYGYVYEVRGKKGWYVGQTIRCVKSKDGTFYRYPKGFTSVFHNAKISSQEEEQFGELRIIDIAYSEEELNWLEYYHMLRRDSIENGYNTYPTTFPKFRTDKTQIQPYLFEV